MPLRIVDAALVVIHGDELGAQRVGVRELLCQPPGVFACAAVVVIAAAHPVERGSVDEVAVAVDQRTIASAVEGDLRVAVEIAAQQLVAAARSRWAGSFAPASPTRLRRRRRDREWPA